MRGVAGRPRHGLPGPDLAQTRRLGRHGRGPNGAGGPGYGLKTLTSLNLRDTKVTCAAVAALASKDTGLQAFTRLSLHCGEVTDKGVAAFASKDTGLKALNIAFALGRWGNGQGHRCAVSQGHWPHRPHQADSRPHEDEGGGGCQDQESLYSEQGLAFLSRHRRTDIC